MKQRFQFSLRTLWITFTVLAIAIWFVATHFRVVIGGAIAAMWLLEFVSSPLEAFVDAWPELKKARVATRAPGETSKS
jgi:predicted tellurium resistance membrane protein TerC